MSKKMTPTTRSADDNGRDYLGPAIVFGIFVAGLCCVIWLTSRGGLATSGADWQLLERETAEMALAEFEVDMATLMRLRVHAWDTIQAALDRAWVMTWASPDQPPPDRVMDSHAYWHIGELDAVVDGQPFQVWRCKFIGEPCDPDADVLCIDLGGDGVSWEFRFNDEEIGTLQIR